MNEKYINQLYTTEHMIIDFYNKYTTPSNKLILIFFESEIKGNIKRAFYVQETHK